MQIKAPFVKFPPGVRLLSLLFVMIALVLPAGCKDGADRVPATAPAPAELLLLAAASTNDAAEDLAAIYQSRTGVKVRITTGGSNALANQIIAGAPGDLFLSANAKWADAVAEKQLAVQRRPLLGNRLVLVTPKANPAGVTLPADLLKPAVRRVALAGENVPAGIYAEQSLRAAGVFDRLVDGRRIARGQDVRLTLSYVETAEAEAGVVYSTDARASGKVDVVYTFPPGAHDTIVYPLVLLKSAGNADAARAFYEFLASPEAMAVFQRHGFSPANVDPANP